MRHTPNPQGPHMLFSVSDNKTNGGQTAADCHDGQLKPGPFLELCLDMSKGNMHRLWGLEQGLMFPAAIAPATWHSLCASFQVSFSPNIFAECS